MQEVTAMVEMPRDEGSVSLPYCAGCGAVAERLHSAPVRVRSLSLGRTIEAGELVCDRCLLELEKERDEQEMISGPA